MRISRSASTALPRPARPTPSCSCCSLARLPSYRRAPATPQRPMRYKWFDISTPTPTVCRRSGRKLCGAPLGSWSPCWKPRSELRWTPRRLSPLRVELTSTRTELSILARLERPRWSVTRLGSGCSACASRPPSALPFAPPGRRALSLLLLVQPQLPPQLLLPRCSGRPPRCSHRRPRRRPHRAHRQLRRHTPRTWRAAPVLPRRGVLL